ncbi:MAG: Lrp/AsnC ligand binding domain-containing protein [Prevotellaceae bacterium]|jgi:Lrp/AsnC family transcriptional regulator for asnA, asnC and gidA|nr:Lrp/AsnC ligand binding domain-containing protein [Prevotellaceae bacterium]
MGRKKIKINEDATEDNSKKAAKKSDKIDNLDRRILSMITKDARMPFKLVSTASGVSRAAIHLRVQRLIDMKVIVGSGYFVNYKALGYEICAYIGITLERGSMYADVISELEKVPEIVESQYTLGSYSILVKLYAKNTNDLLLILNTKIQGIQGVAATETLVSLDERIKRPLPIDFEG